MLLDNVAALANLGMRRTGLAPGTEGERDPAQVRLAIESLRALIPVLEHAAPSQIAAIRDAVSQLQMAYVRIAPDAGAGDPGAAAATGGTGAPDARRCRTACAGAAAEAWRAGPRAAQRAPLGARAVAQQAVN